MKKTEIVRYAKIAGVALIAVVVLIIVAKNFEYVEADLLLVRIHMPLALLVFLTFLLGAGFGFVGATFYIRRRRTEDKGEKKATG